MSTEQMRQEFERAIGTLPTGCRWNSLTSEYQQSWYEYEGDEETDLEIERLNQDYRIWNFSWQASRAAVIVQMPQQSGANPDWNQAIRYCIQAVEAAGLKVKP